MGISAAGRTPRNSAKSAAMSERKGIGAADREVGGYRLRVLGVGALSGSGGQSHSSRKPVLRPPAPEGRGGQGVRTHAAKEVARVSSRRRVFADREASGILGPRGCVQMCMLSFLAA